jgi:type II secretory pathway predicted ATPase ExeA
LLVIFDEAQDIALETFARLKSLTTFNGGGQSPLTLILAGHPELQLRMAEVPSFGQRIGLLFHLRPLTRPETDSYLDHRLRVAGNPTGQVFSEEARRFLFEISGGIPREINRLAKLAIEHAWVAGHEVVATDAVGAIVQDDHKHSILATL